MTESEYNNMPVKFPIEPNAREAVHIDSPAKCYNCDNSESIHDNDKFDTIPDNASFYGIPLK